MKKGNAATWLLLLALTFFASSQDVKAVSVGVAAQVPDRYPEVAWLEVSKVRVDAESRNGGLGRNGFYSGRLEREQIQDNARLMNLSIAERKPIGDTTYNREEIDVRMSITQMDPIRRFDRLFFTDRLIAGKGYIPFIQISIGTKCFLSSCSEQLIQDQTRAGNNAQRWRIAGISKMNSDLGSYFSVVIDKRLDNFEGFVPHPWSLSSPQSPIGFLKSASLKNQYSGGYDSDSYESYSPVSKPPSIFSQKNIVFVLTGLAFLCLGIWLIYIWANSSLRRDWLGSWWIGWGAFVLGGIAIVFGIDFLTRIRLPWYFAVAHVLMYYKNT